MGKTLTSILTSQSKLSTEVQNLQVYLGVALDNMPHGLSMYDNRQRLIVANKAYRAIYALPDLLGRPGTSLSHVIRYYVKQATGREDQEAVNRQLDWVRQEVAALADGKVQIRTQKLHDGRHVRVTTQPLPNGGWVDVHEDVTDFDALEAELRKEASFDETTGLLNGRGFRSHIADLFAGDHPVNVALHVIHFRNDHAIVASHGFGEREALLEKMGPIFRDLAKPHEAARLFRDLFVVAQIFEDYRDVQRLALRIETEFPKSITVAGHEHALELSFLQGLMQGDRTDLDQLIDWIFRQRSAGASLTNART